MSSFRSSPIPLLKVKVAQKGKIKDIKEIVVRAVGLPSCLYGQLVDLGREVKGLVMGFDENDVLILALGDPTRLRMGGELTGVDEPFRIPVARACLGRMLNALGEPCDQGSEIQAEAYLPVLHDSPPITWRAPVTDFLPTGTKVVDSLIPVAKGQRQLIVGDRMTGKTTIALDAIINQQNRGTLCVYCCIGKSLSAVQKAVATLHEKKALEYTVVVVALDNSPAGEQYLVPYSAVTVAEFFAQQDKDVLVVFDDLTKHAWAYRQLSLLLGRPPGREAYPGDIFYVQTQLMERAGKFNDEHGGGSITFLGIAETLQGDLTGYIPSNLSSMCDGQICMSTSLFAEGMRPAVDFSLSTSIIGSRVQPPILKVLARNLRADYARYAEVVQLSKMQSGLSGEAEKTLRKGQAILAALQQSQYQPASLAEETVFLYSVYCGVLPGLNKVQQEKFCEEIWDFAKRHYGPLLAEVETQQTLTPEIEKKLSEMVDAYLRNAAMVK